MRWSECTEILVTGWLGAVVIIILSSTFDHVLPNHGATQSVRLIMGLLIKPDNERTSTLYTMTKKWIQQLLEK